MPSIKGYLTKYQGTKKQVLVITKNLEQGIRYHEASPLRLAGPRGAGILTSGLVALIPASLQHMSHDRTCLIKPQIVKQNVRKA